MFYQDNAIRPLINIYFHDKLLTKSNDAIILCLQGNLSVIKQ